VNGIPVWEVVFAKASDRLQILLYDNHQHVHVVPCDPDHWFYHYQNHYPVQLGSPAVYYQEMDE
jgi:hypothetical protein